MELDALHALRLARHRIDPSRPIHTPEELIGFIRERRIVLVTARGSLPSLTQAIAGRELPGSWMAHPECHEIHALLGRIDSPEILGAPLIEGKGCLLDAGLLAHAVQRLAADPGLRAARVDALDATARELLARLERGETVRMDRSGLPAKEGRRARLALERAWLAQSESVHTERGYHTAVVRAWSASRFAGFERAAAGLTLEEAADRLLLAAVRSAVVAPPREVRRWFPLAGERIEPLVQAGRLVRIDALLAAPDQLEREPINC